MSVLFRETFNGVAFHVLQIRNRTAFLALELGAAAGFSDGGQGFVDLITREWAASFDEDDDLAQLVGAELETLTREVPLPPTTTMALVLFPTGVERALQRSHARYSRSLLGFIHAKVLSRVISLGAGRDEDEGQSGAPATAPPPTSGAKRTSARSPTLRDTVVVTTELRALVGDLQTLADTNHGVAELHDLLQRQVQGYEALIRLAIELRALRLISEEQYAALRVEAVEELLGRSLETTLPPFNDLAHTAAA